MAETHKDILVRYNKLVIKRQMLEKQLSDTMEKMEAIQIHTDMLLSARTVVLEVVNATQEKVKGYIEAGTNHAIKSVFTDRKFEFSLVFGNSRGRTDCRPVLYEDGNEYTPEDDMGGSMLAVLGLSFRVVLMSMQKPKRRRVLLLDEPFLHVDKELLEFVGSIIREISHQANIQIIMITHEPTLALCGDVVYNVTMEDNISKVRLVEGDDLLKPQRVRRK